MNPVRLTRRLWRAKGREPWHHAVFLTYGANLIFFEGAVWPELPPLCGTVVLLADEGQYLESCESEPTQGVLRHVNQRYLFDGIAVPRGVAHAKLILLTGPDAGRLLVGSGNVGSGGYLSGGELFVEYEYAEDMPDELGAFQAARDLLQRLVDDGRVGEFAAERITHVLSQVPWLFGTTEAGSSVLRHNLDEPLAMQLQREVAGQRVFELDLLAPFFDQEAATCADLLTRLSPERAVVYVHDGTSVSPDALAALGRSYAGDLEVRLFSKADASYVHAKAYLARLPGQDMLLTGSPNLTHAALLATVESGNFELASLLSGEPGTFDSIFTALGEAPKVESPAELDLSFKPMVAGGSSGPTLIRALWQDDSLQLSGRGDAPNGVVSLDIGAARFTLAAAQAEVTAPTRWFLSVHVSDELVAILTRPVSVRLSWGEGSNAVTTNAVYPCNVKRITAESSRSVTGSGSGVFEGVEFGDLELERLLYSVAELAIDSVSLHEIAGHKTGGSVGLPDDVEGTHYAYGELQLKDLSQHPRLRQYEFVSHGGGRGTTPAELLLTYINSFYASFVHRQPAESSAATATAAELVLETGELIELEDILPAGTEETLGEGETTEIEDDELADEQAGKDEAAELRARVLERLIYRYLKGLASEEFLRLIGYERVSVNYALFNHVFWRLADLAWLSADYLSGAIVSALGIFWGGAAGEALFAKGTPESTTAVQEMLVAQHDVPTTLALLWYVESTTDAESGWPRRKQARDVLCRILTSDAFQVTAEDWEVASAFVRGFGQLGQASPDLGSALTRLAHFVADDELTEVLVRDVGPWCAHAHWVHASVIRKATGVKGQRCLCLPSLEALRTQAQAEKLVAVLLRVRPGVEYIHCVSPEIHQHDRVAIYDQLDDHGVFLNRATGKGPAGLPTMVADAAPWEPRLAEWQVLVEANPYVSTPSAARPAGDGV